MREKLNEEQQQQNQFKSTSDLTSKRSSSFTEPRTQHVRPSFLNSNKTGHSQHQSRKPFHPDASSISENQNLIITCNAGSVKSLVDIYETNQQVFSKLIIHIMRKNDLHFFLNFFC